MSSDAAPLRILYVEDDRPTRLLGALTLQRHPRFEVLACADAVDALTRAPSFRPELFLLDIQLPDLDGPSLLEELRRLPGLADRRAIFMSASRDPAELLRARGYAPLGIILKPFDPRRFAQQVEALWASRKTE